MQPSAMQPRSFARIQWTGFILLMLGILDLTLGKTIGKSLVPPLPPGTLGVPPELSGAFLFVTISTVALLAVGAILFGAGIAMQRRQERIAGIRRTDPSPFLRIWVWAHVCIITLKCLPSAPDEIKGERPKRAPFGTEYLLLATDALEPLLDVYLWPTGFWQDWGMFAPNPSDWDGYVTAELLFKDGSRKTHLYPRMAEMGLGIKYFKERYRKFLERAHSEKFDWLWPQFALRIALENYSDPANPPVGIQLWRHWAIVPPTVTFPEYVSGLGGSSGRSGLAAWLPENPAMPKQRSYRYLPDHNRTAEEDAFWPIDEQQLNRRANL